MRWGVLQVVKSIGPPTSDMSTYDLVICIRLHLGLRIIRIKTNIHIHHFCLIKNLEAMTYKKTSEFNKSLIKPELIMELIRYYSIINPNKVSR